MEMNTRNPIVHALGLALLVTSLPLTAEPVPAGFREMTPEERAYMQEIVDEMYDRFVEVVAQGREEPKPANEPEDATETETAATDKPAEPATSEPDNRYAEIRRSREALMKSMKERRLALQKKREARIREIEAEAERARKEAMKQRQERMREMAALMQQMEQQRKREEAMRRKMEAQIESAIANVGRPAPPSGGYYGYPVPPRYPAYGPTPYYPPRPPGYPAPYGAYSYR